MVTSSAARPAVVLLSGGLDSTTVLAIAAAEGAPIHALSFAYGQRHAVELACAARQARRFGARAHEVVDLAHMGRLVAPATALIAGSAHDVPRGRDLEDGAIPITYVPARNTLFLAYALAWAEALAAATIWIGVNALDYSGYPDCRPDFLAAFQATADLATRAGREGHGPRLEAPLALLRKSEIIRRGAALGVDYADTISCYAPVPDGDDALACGTCDSCRLRAQGFAEAGLPDPTRYVGA